MGVKLPDGRIVGQFCDDDDENIQTFVEVSSEAFYIQNELVPSIRPKPVLSDYTEGVFLHHKDAVIYPLHNQILKYGLKVKKGDSYVILGEISLSAGSGNRNVCSVYHSNCIDDRNMKIQILFGVLTVNGMPIEEHWSRIPENPSCIWVTDNALLSSSHYRLTMVIRRKELQQAHLSRSRMLNKNKWNSREPIIKIDKNVPWKEAIEYLKEIRVNSEEINEEHFGKSFQFRTKDQDGKIVVSTRG